MVVKKIFDTTISDDNNYIKLLSRGNKTSFSRIHIYNVDHENQLCHPDMTSLFNVNEILHISLTVNINTDNCESHFLSITIRGVNGTILVKCIPLIFHISHLLIKVKEESDNDDRILEFILRCQNDDFITISSKK